MRTFRCEECDLTRSAPLCLTFPLLCLLNQLFYLAFYEQDVMLLRTELVSL